MNKHNARLRAAISGRKRRRKPDFLDSVIPVPNAHLCDNRTEQGKVFTGTAKMPTHGRIW